MYRLMKLWMLPGRLLELWKERRHVRREMAYVDEKYRSLCRSQWGKP